jgi:hypothetical protein
MHARFGASCDNILGGSVQIILTQSGGIIGRARKLGPIDTSLDIESSMLDPLVAACNFFGLAPTVGDMKPDARVDSIEVVDGARTHTVRWDVEGAPDGNPLTELFEAAQKVGIANGLAWMTI